MRPTLLNPNLKPWQVEMVRHAAFHSIDIQKSFNKRMADAKKVTPQNDIEATLYQIDQMLIALFSSAVLLACRYMSPQHQVEEICINLVRKAFAGERMRAAAEAKKARIVTPGPADA